MDESMITELLNILKQHRIATKNVFIASACLFALPLAHHYIRRLKKELRILERIISKWESEHAMRNRTSLTEEIEFEDETSDINTTSSEVLSQSTSDCSLSRGNTGYLSLSEVEPKKTSSNKDASMDNTGRGYSNVGVQVNTALPTVESDDYFPKEQSAIDPDQSLKVGHLKDLSSQPDLEFPMQPETFEKPLRGSSAKNVLPDESKRSRRGSNEGDKPISPTVVKLIRSIGRLVDEEEKNRTQRKNYFGGETSTTNEASSNDESKQFSRHGKKTSETGNDKGNKPLSENVLKLVRSLVKRVDEDEENRRIRLKCDRDGGKRTSTVRSEEVSRELSEAVLKLVQSFKKVVDFNERKKQLRKSYFGFGSSMPDEDEPMTKTYDDDESKNFSEDKEETSIKGHEVVKPLSQKAIKLIRTLRDIDLEGENNGKLRDNNFGPGSSTMNVDSSDQSKQFSRDDGDKPLNETVLKLARSLGKRVDETEKRLRKNRPGCSTTTSSDEQLSRHGGETTSLKGEENPLSETVLKLGRSLGKLVDESEKRKLPKNRPGCSTTFSSDESKRFSTDSYEMASLEGGYKPLSETVLKLVRSLGKLVDQTKKSQLWKNKLTRSTTNVTSDECKLFSGERPSIKGSDEDEKIPSKAVLKLVQSLVKLIDEKEKGKLWKKNERLMLEHSANREPQNSNSLKECSGNESSETKSILNFAIAFRELVENVEENKQLLKKVRRTQDQGGSSGSGEDQGGSSGSGEDQGGSSGSGEDQGGSSGSGEDQGSSSDAGEDKGRLSLQLASNSSEISLEVGSNNDPQSRISLDASRGGHVETEKQSPRKMNFGWVIEHDPLPEDSLKKNETLQELNSKATGHRVMDKEMQLERSSKELTDRGKSTHKANLSEDKDHKLQEKCSSLQKPSGSGQDKPGSSKVVKSEGGDTSGWESESSGESSGGDSRSNNSKKGISGGDGNKDCSVGEPNDDVPFFKRRFKMFREVTTKFSDDEQETLEPTEPKRVKKDNKSEQMDVDSDKASRKRPKKKGKKTGKKARKEKTIAEMIEEILETKKRIEEKGKTPISPRYQYKKGMALRFHKQSTDDRHLPGCSTDPNRAPDETNRNVEHPQQDSSSNLKLLVKLAPKRAGNKRKVSPIQECDEEIGKKPGPSEQSVALPPVSCLLPYFSLPGSSAFQERNIGTIGGTVPQGGSKEDSNIYTDESDSNSVQYLETVINQKDQSSLQEANSAIPGEGDQIENDPAIQKRRQSESNSEIKPVRTKKSSILLEALLGPKKDPERTREKVFPWELSPSEQDPDEGDQGQPDGNQPDEGDQGQPDGNQPDEGDQGQPDGTNLNVEHPRDDSSSDLEIVGVKLAPKRAGNKRKRSPIQEYEKEMGKKPSPSEQSVTLPPISSIRPYFSLPGSSAVQERNISTIGGIDSQRVSKEDSSTCTDESDSNSVQYLGKVVFQKKQSSLQEANPGERNPIENNPAIQKKIHQSEIKQVGTKESGDFRESLLGPKMDSEQKQPDKGNQGSLGERLHQSEYDTQVRTDDQEKDEESSEDQITEDMTSEDEESNQPTTTDPSTEDSVSIFDVDSNLSLELPNPPEHPVVNQGDVGVDNMDAEDVDYSNSNTDEVVEYLTSKDQNP